MNETVFPLEEFRTRVRNVRAAMAAEGLDALLFVGARNWFRDHYIRYLANYDAPGPLSLMVLPLEGEPTLLIGEEWDLARARAVTWIDDVRADRDLAQAAVDVLREVLRSTKLDTVKLGVAGGEGLGFSALEALPSHVFRGIAGAFPRTDLVEASASLESIRLIRSPREIEVLRQAARIGDAGAQAFYATAREGISERELWTEVWYAMQSAGAQDVHSSIARGPGSFWMHPPSGARLAKGDFISEEFSPRLHGYFSQSNRMCIVGGLTREWRELCRAALEARDTAIQAIKPGAVACEVVEKVAKVVAKSQVGTMDMGGVHRVGQGAGLCLDEAPYLTSASRTVLQEGMTMAVHPIIYVPYIHSLLMLGEYVLVTKDGCEVLTRPQTEILGV